MMEFITMELIWTTNHEEWKTCQYGEAKTVAIAQGDDWVLVGDADETAH